METTARLNRIHPLMAAAAASVVIVSLTGAAAITGLLPTSKSAPDAQAALAAASPYGMQQPGMVPMTNAQGQLVMVPAAAVQGQMATPLAATQVTPQMAMQLAAGPQQLNPQLQAQQMAMPLAGQQLAYVQAAQPAPVVVKEVIREKPVVRVVEKTRVVHHHHTAKATRASEPRYYPQPAPAPAQPNYVGIGTGAVIGGLIGNQIGGGNGKKLATVAGVIGGGLLGNEIANRNR
ncbi:glycine zipper 2TM domain-containing protein [Telluria aromaticivorans]|uniref:Glycine zipper 2TM domain-containing protein n=1 Tax=Telluria aromaticivorans TaxID=2725995 RepID=A0A7Y2P0U0_9BURK|nr:glycine zipper 2TM domain-containing protein [Telluria aromaticivorans]NNG24519.1 glycine zipper 2TM domain-containing protein [Telluria aromaticivorans]